MKYYLSLIAAAALGLSACSQEAAAPAPASAPVEAPAASAPAAAPAEAASADAQAAACEVMVEANDQMKFNTDNINISKQCTEFTITLKHVGTLPKAAMGHNVVIAKTADVSAVAADGTAAGADGDFVKAGDARIVAYTKLIGGGEETKVTFDPAKLADGDYSFFCSFPGHEGLMRGTVKLVD